MISEQPGNLKGDKKRDTLCLGTRGYAAPEQYGDSGETDGRTDIYGLGSNLYYLLTGHDPGTAPYEICPIRRWDPWLSPGLVKNRPEMHQKKPEDRYPSCKALMYDLEHYKQLNRKYKRRQKPEMERIPGCFFHDAMCGDGSSGILESRRKGTGKVL